MFGVTTGVYVDASDFNAKMAQLQMRLSAVGLLAFMNGVLVPHLQQRAQRRFNTEGDEVSGKWRPLAKSTEQLRIYSGHPAAHPINVRTGQMRGFVTTATGNVRSAGGMAQLTWPGNTPTGTLLKKMQTAQMGSPHPHTVPRPVVGLGVEDNIFAIATLTQYLLS